MAGWRGGDRIGKHLLSSRVFNKITLIFIALFISVPTMTYAQQGFLSIDCGYRGANYTDPNTNLTWTGDYSYIKTGESYVQTTFNLADAGSQWLQSFRFFPEPRNKYCYELPTVTINDGYLIRASFYLNETVLKERRPFQFVLYLDATNWFTLTSGNDSMSTFSAVAEVIVQPPNDITNFCIQPVIGVPFISSLELRELNNTMYNYNGDAGEYLALLFRYNLGATNTTPSVRFPDDKFDRIWQPAADITYGVTVSANLTDNQTNANANFVPPNVMQHGWDAGEGAFYFTLYSIYLPVYITPSQYAFALIYTENLNTNDSNVNSLNVTFYNPSAYTYNNYYDFKYNLYFPGTFSDQASLFKCPYISLSTNILKFSFTQLNATEFPTAGVGPTLNAIEVYGQYAYNFSSTNPNDIFVHTALKTSLNLDDGQGDPCVPVPVDWLTCYPFNLEPGSYSDYNPAEKPCGLKGNSMTYCSAEQEEPTGMFIVIALNLQNISNVNAGLSLFISSLINRSGGFIWLNEVSITRSELTSETLQNFMQYVSAGASILDFSYNDFSYNALTHINSSNWTYYGGRISLNLSHNEISRVDAFTKFPLETLDLSYNELTLIPDGWSTSYDSSLVFLDLSHNQLQGQISSLDQIVQVYNKSLQAINISNNNLEGSFSSSLYFSDLPNLTTGIFDQNNITGTLDLSMWYNSLLKVAGFQTSSPNTVTGQLLSFQNSSANTVTRQLFSFVNNTISDISPNADTIMPVMDAVMKKYNSTPFGILLGGNPYCSSAQSYAQRYLCRYTIHQTIPPEAGLKRNDMKIILIIAISGGIVALLLTGVTSATVWKLWKQVRSLRAIQQALATRKVQPPFYQYNDLKLATKDFHKDYELGKGGYGIVYKGVLEDDTKLAVKKLFASKGSQNRDDLNEFLNEVVLITGIKHRNLVHLKGCCVKDKQRMLVYEYAEKGNLAEALWGSKAYGSLDWGQRFNICMGVARGLLYLHDELQPSIIHRDIKPENILLDNNLKPKIADFGLARHSSNETSEAHYTYIVAGTKGYLSPEYAIDGKLSDKADVYSYGIVVLEVISGRKCIDHSLPNDKVYLKYWVQEMYKAGMMWDVLQDEIRDNCVVDEVMRTMKIGLLCVQNSPQSRPSMSEVVTMLLGSRDVREIVEECTDFHLGPKDIFEGE